MKQHDGRLSVHHIGGRNGSRGFPIHFEFEKDIISVLYDGDADCVPQILENNRYLQSELHVLPYCVGGTDRTAQFNINYDPYTSSLLDTNEDYGSFSLMEEGCDYVFSEVMKSMEKRTIDLVTIDQLMRQEEGTIPPPDFLSVDTEGAEFEIIQGAQQTVHSHVLGLILEVAFHPIRKDQKLFGDVTKLMADQGFHFVKFHSLHPHQMASPFRSPVGLRGEGFQLFADAFYLRRIDSISGNGLESYIMLQKLAFISVIFNQLEYGLECLKRAQTLDVPDSDREKLSKLSYFKFLKTLEQQAQNMPKAFPDMYASQHSFEAIQSSFQVHVSMGPGVRDRLRSVPILFPLLRRLRQAVWGITGLPACVGNSLTGKYSGVETTLIDYGLQEEAELVRQKRLHQSRFL